MLDTVNQTIKLTVSEALPRKNFFTELAQYTCRFLMSVRSISVRYKDTRSFSIPQFVPEVGDIFGQNSHYDVMAPGLGFAFGFVDESYLQRIKERGWLLADQSMISPALYSRAKEFNAEVQLEPIKGLKITLTGNRTDNRTNQIHFMYDDMNAIYSGSYTKTHVAIATAMRGMNASKEYQSAVFDRFLENIPVVAQRLQNQYSGKNYPSTGFLSGTVYANQLFNPDNGGVNTASSDVLIPAFMAAYSGRSAKSYTLNPFPSIRQILPNWRVTYDGLGRIPGLKKRFKSITLTHAYQCTYQVGSFNSFSDWVTIGNGLGFTQDALTNSPIPSSPYNISSVTLTEKFAPLIGISATMNNDLTFNAEYRDERTVTLNATAGQVVEAMQRSLVIGAGYKIANFNTILKIKKTQTGVSNDLTLNFNFKLANNTALIRKIEGNSAQPTSGARSLGINFTANYVVSSKITIGAYFDHQVNTPLVSSTAYPTTNSNYGIYISG